MKIRSLNLILLIMTFLFFIWWGSVETFYPDKIRSEYLNWLVTLGIFYGIASTQVYRASLSSSYQGKLFLFYVVFIESTVMAWARELNLLGGSPYVWIGGLLIGLFLGKPLIQRGIQKTGIGFATGMLVGFWMVVVWNYYTYLSHAPAIAPLVPIDTGEPHLFALVILTCFKN